MAENSSKDSNVCSPSNHYRRIKRSIIMAVAGLLQVQFANQNSISKNSSACVMSYLSLYSLYTNMNSEKKKNKSFERRVEFT